MGGGKGGKHQTSFSRIPDSAHSADTKIDAVICKDKKWIPEVNLKKELKLKKL